MAILTDKFDSFGLDIGDLSIKVAYVKIHGDDLELKKYGSIQLPPKTIEKGNIINESVAISNLKDLLKNTIPQETKEKYVHACLPETQTFIKLLGVKFEDKKDLNARIREEIENHIPLEIEKSYFDWRILKKDEVSKTVRVLVGAVSKQTADSYNSFLYKAGLIPVSLRIEAESILNSIIPFEMYQTAETTAIIDIGATRSGFLLFGGGAMQFSASLAISGEDITNQIALKMKFTKEEAEKIKSTCGLLEGKCERAIFDIIDSEMLKLAQSVKENCDFYVEHFENSSKISNIILCGGGAYLPGIIENLKTKLPSSSIIFARPTINFVKDKKKFFKENQKENFADIYGKLSSQKDLLIPETFSQKHELSYATAIGLAISNVL